VNLDDNSARILHVDLIALKDEAAMDARETIIEAAAALGAIEGVTRVSAIEADAGSDYDLALLFLLDDSGALEPFGTDVRYVRFLQATVAPSLKSFAGADVRLDAALPVVDAFGACLALAAPPQTYDWEVRQHLETWLRGTCAGVAGLAAGERQRFRGLALAFDAEPLRPERPSIRSFEVTMLAGRARAL